VDQSVERGWEFDYQPRNVLQHGLVDTINHLKWSNFNSAAFRRMFYINHRCSGGASSGLKQENWGSSPGGYYNKVFKLCYSAMNCQLLWICQIKVIIL